MNEDVKNFIRAAHLPLDIKVFTKQTQEDFKKIAGIEEDKNLNAFLKKSAARSGLLYMLKSEMIKSQHDFDIELIRKDLEIIEACVDQPIEMISEGNSWRTISFFEDLSVLIADDDIGPSPIFYDNYYQYIFNNLWRISVWIYNSDSLEAKKSFKRCGLTFLEKDGEPYFEYTREFRNGLFLNDWFKLKRDDSQ